MGLPAGIQMSEEHRRAIGLGMRKARRERQRLLKLAQKNLQKQKEVEIDDQYVVIKKFCRYCHQEIKE